MTIAEPSGRTGPSGRPGTSGPTASSAAVVDASALAALLFGEPDAEAVAARLAGRRLVAPTLLRYELASVFLKKWRRHPERRAALESMLRLHPDMDIEEVQADIRETAALAERSGFTAYDAAYLWVSDRLRAPLVTLDERLAAAARGR